MSVKTFAYTASDRTSRTVRGRALAEDEPALDRQLEERGLLLTRAREVSARAGVMAHVVSARRLGASELVRVSAQLATLVGAGVPIATGLAGIARRAASANEREVLAGMIARLEAGESLSRAMELARFPRELVAAVRAGEASGALERVLGRAARHLEWVHAMRATTLQALVYPALLCSAIGGLVLILLHYVMPRLVGLFPGGRADLPLETRALLAVSDGLAVHGVPILCGLALAVLGVLHGLRSPGTRRALHGILFRLPAVGDLARRIATSKLVSTAATLVSAGCDVFTVLGVSAQTSGNAALEGAFERAAERVRAGRSIGEALAPEPLVDPLLVQMVGVGEASGDLAGSLDRLSQFYDDEVPRSVKRTLALLEPSLLLGAGALVAFILLAALLPILDAYEAF